MQANSQHPGQQQSLHGNGDNSGDRTSHNMDHNCYQICLPPPSANHSNPGQTTTGNYLTQFSCTILQTTSNQIVSGNPQSTNETKPAQENHFDPKCTLQNSKYILWNMPVSSCQIFLPASNINLQGPIDVASNNNGPNISHGALRPNAEAVNYNNSVCMKQKTSSMPAGPNSSQQFKAKTIINTKSLDDTGDLNPCILRRRQQHANASNNLSKGPSEKRMTLPSDSKYLATENAPHGHSSSFGGHMYHRLTTESSSIHANLQALSTCKRNLQQNSATQKAVAVVTPLSPISEMLPVKVSNKSANVVNVRSAHTVHHQPNVPHLLEATANLQAMGEPSDPTSKHRRPMSGEPRQDDGFCDAVGAKSPVCTSDSTSQSNRASSPKLKSVIAAQLKSVSPNRVQNKASEKMSNNNPAMSDTKTNVEETDRYSTIPIIEWPLEKLHTLIDLIQQIEDGHNKNVNKTNAGKEILKLYWNGDFHKFHNAVQSGIYQSVMQEVYSQCPSKDVILRQIKTDARNQVAKEFHILKPNEAPPKMVYKSSWMNLNEKLDDIDRECGNSWYYNFLHGNSPERAESEEGNSAHKLQSNSLDAPDKLSLTKHNQCPTETVNNVAQEEQTPLKLKQKNSDNKIICENLPVSSNEQLLPVTDDNYAPKMTAVVAEQTSCQPNIVNPLKGLTTLVKGFDKQGVPPGKSEKPKLIDRFHCVGSPVTPEPSSQNGCTRSPKLNPVVSIKQQFVTSHDQTGSNKKVTNSDCTITDKSVRSEIVSNSSEEVALEINKEIDKMDTSASIKFNVSPHKTSSIISGNLSPMHCSDEEFPIGVAQPEMMHKPPCLNTPQVLDTISREEQISVEGFEENATNSAPAIQSTLLDAPNEASITGHDQCMTEIVNKIPVEEKACLELKETISGSRSLHKNLPVSFNEQSLAEANCSSKSDNVVKEQTSCQPNTVNPLQAITNLVKTLSAQNVSKRKRQRSTAGTSGKPRLDDSFYNRVKTKSPVLSYEATCPSSLNPVVGKQQEVVLTSQTNKSDVKNSAHTTQSTLVDSPCEPSQTGHQSVRETVNQVPVEERVCFELKEKNSDNDSRSLLEETDEFAVIQTDENPLLKPNSVVAEHTNCQPNTANPLKGITNLLRTLKKSDFSLRMYEQQIGKKKILKRMHPHSIDTSGKPVRNDRFCNDAGDRSPRLIDKSPLQSDFARSPKLSPVVAEQQEVTLSSPVQNYFNIKLPNSECAKTDKTIQSTLLDATDEPPIPEQDHNAMEIVNEGPVKQQTSFDLKENGSENQRLNENLPVFITDQSPVVTNDNGSLKHKSMVTEQSNQQPNIANMVWELYKREELGEPDALASIKINVLPHEIAKQWFAGEMAEERDLQKDIAVHTSSKDQIKVQVLDPSDDHVDVQVLDPSDDHVDVQVLDPSDDHVDVQVLDPSDDHVDVQVLDPSDDHVDVQVLDPSDDQVDVQALDPSDDQVDVQALEPSYDQVRVQALDPSDDQVEVEVIDLRSEKEVLIEDVKPKERNSQGAVEVKLEPYCCLVKWFQTLKYVDGSLCMCQVKSEISQKEIKARGSSLEVPTNEKDCVNIFSNDYGCMELKKITLKQIDKDASECTKAKTLAISHTDTPNNAAVDMTKIVKDHSVSKGVFKAERTTSEQVNDELPSKCAQNGSLKHYKKHTPSLDVKRTSKTICLSLYGSSSNERVGEIRNKRNKKSCEKTPKSLAITFSSHHNNERRRNSEKRKWVGSMENEDALDTGRKKTRASVETHDQSRSPQLQEVTPTRVSKVTKENALSSTLTRNLFNQSHNLKSDTCLADKDKQKKKHLGMRQISLDRYIIKRKTVPSKSLQSPETVMKSKYELGNPALMPLQEGFGLEFKVLPTSFNFGGTKLNHVQADTTSAQKEISYPEDRKAKRMKTSLAPTQGNWHFSPLKTRHIQSTISGSCNLFQQFKKRYQERKKEMAPRQNLNSN